MQIIRGRWRGRMPYRCTRSRKPFIVMKGRTGEPSPASPKKLTPGQMTRALWQWIRDKEKLDKISDWSVPLPLEFKYRLSRKRTVTVVGTGAAINRSSSGGKWPSLFLRRIQSIDGVPLDFACQLFSREFPLSRIVSGLPKEILGREQQPEPKQPLVSKIKGIRRRKIRWD